MCINVYLMCILFLRGIMFPVYLCTKKSSYFFDKVERRKQLSYIIYHLLGLIFIISGVTKALDLKSFTTLVAEYGVSFVGDWVVILRMPIAVGLCLIEIIIGVISLFRHFTLIISIAYIILIITFLYLTSCNYFADSVYRIESCGCFGDFIHLSPLQTFIKNIALTALAIINISFIRGSYHTPK